jgi:hypothetical protein
MYAQYPGKDWYFMIDDDTYLMMENMHWLLSQKDPTIPYYFGSPTVFAGCDNVKHFGDGPAFAHGGSGIVMSRAAVEIMLLNPPGKQSLDECIWRYRDCWAGDIRLALCFRDMGVLITNPFGPEGLNAGTPHWSSWKYGKDPCHRPFTFHHLTGATMLKIYQAERLAFDRVVNETQRVAFRSDMMDTRKHLEPRFSNTWDPRVPSPFYAPVNEADLWEIFVNQDQELPEMETDMERAGERLKTKKNVKEAKLCRAFCVQNAKCLAWNYVKSTQECQLNAEAAPPGKKDAVVSGIVKHRRACQNPTY